MSDDGVMRGLAADLIERVRALDGGDRQSFVILARLIEQDPTKSRGSWRLLETVAAMVAQAGREEDATLRGVARGLAPETTGWLGDDRHTGGVVGA